ncbi:MAG: PqqD family protein [Betaproteobacteria bacterium]|nr:MAG: PqqD family protein [Betaproteobacteria bacterium]
MKPNTLLTVPDDVVFRDLAGEAVLLHLATGTYFGLDTVGTRIWHLLAEHQSTDLILPLLLQEFDVTEKQLRLDLDDLVTQLLAHRLLLAANDPA